jgi:hypothetical protein
MTMKRIVSSVAAQATKFLADLRAFWSEITNPDFWASNAQ